MKLFSTIALIWLVAACTPRQEPLNIGGGTYLGYQPLFLAAATLQCPTCSDNTRFIGNKPIEFRTLQSTSSVLRLFRARELDGALLSLDEAISLHQQTAGDVCIVEVLSESTSADAIVARKGLDSHEPFVVGYEQSFVGAYLLVEAINKLDWHKSKITVRYVTPSQHVTTLLNGDVDAMVTFEPYLSRLLTDHTEVLFSSANLPGEILNVMVLRKQAYLQHKDLIEWLMNDYLASGVQAIKEASPVAVTYLEESMGLSKENLLTSLQGLYFYTQANRHELSHNELEKKIKKISENKGMESIQGTLKRCDAI